MNTIIFIMNFGSIMLRIQEKGVAYLKMVDGEGFTLDRIENGTDATKVFFSTTSTTWLKDKDLTENISFFSSKL